MESDLDCNNGHVQPDGGYHYHGFPYGLYDTIRILQIDDERTEARSEIVLLGWAFDGNPIYGEECGLGNSSKWYPRSSYEVVVGRRGAGNPTNAYPKGWFVEDWKFKEYLFDFGGYLDECNGHTDIVPEFPDGIYHYHILKKSDVRTDIGFPYIGRCYRLFHYLSGPNIFPRH